MSYEFSWNILEDAFDNISDVLGNTVSEEVMDHGVCEELMRNIISENTNNSEAKKSDDVKAPDPRISENIEEVLEELTPVGRSRSNSWPRRKLGLQSVSIFDTELKMVSEEGGLEEEVSVNPRGPVITKKNGRRNPWGPYSYSDIIVQAISSSPDQCLTLTQIYDWMVTNIPYFSNRQDNNSSAGWKNSIRHNLSLHNKFIKLPNEDPGKSSWWKINHEIKQVSKPRRRATYGDSKSFQNKREKARKKAEAQATNGRLERSSSSAWLQTLSPLHTYQMPGQNFSSSSTSSCDDISLSSFRSRSFSSSSSTTSPTSPPHLPDLAIPSLHDLVGDATVETDLDDIRLDDLNIETSQGQDIPDTAEIIREYLQPSNIQYSSNDFHSKNLMILQPRDTEPVGNSVIKFAHSDSSVTTFETPFLSSLRKEGMKMNHDEERKLMIKNKLNSLIKKRVEINQTESTLSVDNKKNLDSAVLMQIRMLEEEIEKIEKQQPESEYRDQSLVTNISYAENRVASDEDMT